MNGNTARKAPERSKDLTVLLKGMKGLLPIVG